MSAMLCTDPARTAGRLLTLWTPRYKVRRMPCPHSKGQLQSILSHLRVDHTADSIVIEASPKDVRR